MGADLVVHWVCAAKEALGDGDPVRGALRIVELCKARSRAEAVLAQFPAQPRETVSFTIRVQTPHGVRERQVLAVDLLAEAAPLAAWAPGCDGCAANHLRRPYGCYGAVSYPITAVAEQWLVDRAEPADRLGGKLLVDAIADFGYTGAPIAPWREQGLLEASPAPVRALAPGVAVTGDQLLQALFGVGTSLDPLHCVLVLMWFGAVAIDGEVPGALDPAPLQALGAMHTVDERARRTRLVLPPTTDRGVAELQGLLGFLHTTFVVGVPLLVDA